LQQLLQETGIVSIEVDVAQLLDNSYNQRATNPDSGKCQTAHSAGKTPVVYTSRQELVFADVQARLEFGAAVSSLLMDIVAVCHLILAS